MRSSPAAPFGPARLPNVVGYRPVESRHSGDVDADEGDTGDHSDYH